MTVDDSKAGKVGRCLQCDQKFRVPDNREADPGDPPRHSSAPAASESASNKRKVPRPSEPPPPASDDNVMSSSGYLLEEAATPPSPPVKRRRRVDEDVDDEEEERGPDDRVRPAPQRRKKLKRRQQGAGPRLQDILTALGIAGVFCAILVILTFWVHEVTYLLLIIGALVAAAGRRMILHLALQEGKRVWLACLVVPFYPTYFFFTRINETYKAFLVSCAGYLFLISGGGLWLFFIFGARHKDNVKNLADEAVRPSVLTLLVEGKEVRIPINELIYCSVKRGREKFPDFFEIEGKGVNLFGEFWLGFNQEWRDAIDKPARITSHDVRERGGDSHVALPGKGDMKVVKGELVVKQVQDNEDEDDPFLRGTIELELKGRGQQRSLNVSGTFEVQVHSFY
jgi:hypothetical protein